MNQVNQSIKAGRKQPGKEAPVHADQKDHVEFRWVKFEEEVESGGRWSKPHVATLSLHSLLELRNFISKGSVILDMHAEQLPVIVGSSSSGKGRGRVWTSFSADMILDDMIANGSLGVEKRAVVRNALLLKHVHQVRGWNETGWMSIDLLDL